MGTTEIIIIATAAFAALVAGYLIGYFMMRSAQKNKLQEIRAKAEEEAEVIKKEKILQAKEKFMQLKAEYDKQVVEKNKSILEGENRIKQKENSLNQKTEDYRRKETELAKTKENYTTQLGIIEIRRTETEE